MAYAVTALQNVQYHRHTSAREVMYLPGDPGVTYTKGEMCILGATAGVLTKATDSQANAVFRVLETTVCPAATQAFVKPSDFFPRRKESKDLCLVPVQVMVGDGAPVYLANIDGEVDETVASWTAGTRTAVVTTGFAVNDYPNGALAYVYEGPGIGEVNVVEDYVHSSLSVIFHRNFVATLTSSSKIMFLASATAANAVGLFGRVDLSDEDEIDMEDGADDGNYVVYGDWKQIADHLRLGQLPIIGQNHLLNG